MSLFTTIFLLGSHFAHGAPGFWQVDPRSNFPLDAVVHIVLFSDDAQELIARNDVARAQSRILAASSGVEREIRELEFSRPSANGVVTIARHVRHGTAVLIDDGRTLVTANHLFEGVRAKNHKIVLLNSQRDVLLDTRFRPKTVQGFDLARVASRSRHRLGRLAATVLVEAIDARLLKLPEDLPFEPIRALTASAPTGTSLLLLSYPEATSTRSSLHAVPDSPGFQLRASVGQIVPRDARYTRFLTRRLPDEALRDDFVTAKIFADVDLVPGSSGGPVFGPDGRLVGLMTARLDYDSSSPFEYVTRGGHGVSARTLFELVNFKNCELNFL